MNKNKFIYIKTKNTISLSTTGKHCYLNCAHCNKLYLEKMIDISDYRDKDIEFFENNLDLKISNILKYDSFLISGGMDENLEIPIFYYESFFKFLKKRNKLLNFHIGFLDKSKFDILFYSDAISLDIIFSQDAITQIYKINKKPEDYINKLLEIIDFANKNNLKTKIAPHITICLNFYKQSNEKEIINFFSSFDKIDFIDKIVLNILKENINTNFNSKPDLNYIKEILTYSKNTLKDKTIFLGCMRPSGIYRKEIDNYAYEIGIHGIVNPSFNKINEKFLYYDKCCALYPL